MYVMLLILVDTYTISKTCNNYDVIYVTCELLGKTAGLFALGSGPTPAAAGHVSGD